MKKIGFIFSLLFLCVNLHAQTKRLVLFGKDNAKDTTSIHVGDFVKVKLMDGKMVKGNVASVESDFFMVGVDTVRPEQVKEFGYRIQNRSKKGNVFVLVGGLLIAGGLGLIALSSKANDVGESYSEFIIGALVGIAGVPVVIGGIVKNRGIDRGKRIMGKHWGLKIA